MSAVLVIAGVDSSGGAGLARDLRTLAQLGTSALCAVTAVTVQSDAELIASHLMPPQLVSAAVAAALASGRVAAVKVGMLGSAAIVRAVAAALPAVLDVPIVLDPVLASSSGGSLLDAEGRAALIEWLLPRVTLLTPNVPEAALLLGTPLGAGEAALLQQAQQLRARGARAVLLKGGHAPGAQATDFLVSDCATQRLATARRAGSRRGTGCALATAIAAGLGAGLPLAVACQRAKDHVTQLFDAPP